MRSCCKPIVGLWLMVPVESWEGPYELVQAKRKRPGHIEVTVPYWIYSRVVEFLKTHAIHGRLKSVEIDRLDFRRCIENRDASTTFLSQASLMDLFSIAP